MTMLRTFLGVSLAVLLLGACSDDSAETDGGLLDAAVDALQQEAGGDGQIADQGQADAAGPGKATDVQLDMHGNEVKIQLDTMKVVGKEATTWDLYMAHDDGPNMYLGNGVTGQNLGNAKTYHQVDTAPDSGYETDDTTTPKLVIGTTWRNGGSGTTGYIMTKNIYVVKLADGTYAKLEVLSAKSGKIHILCYRQGNGTRDLETVP